MKFFAATFCLIFFSFSLSAQTASNVLATANGRQFTAQDLPPNVGESFARLDAALAETRRAALARLIADRLLEEEAKTQKTTVEKLVNAENKRRAPTPTEAQIKAVYDANRAAVGDRTLDEVRPQIVAFLNRENEQKALANFVESLKIKYKAANLKDAAAPNLQPTDVLATVGGRQITWQNLEDAAAPDVYELKAQIYDRVSAALEQIIYSNLISAEAKVLGIQTENFIAREITGKMRDYSDEEREGLEAALQNRLFQKYDAKILLEEPAPYAQKISIDDDPARGLAGAPVTVVMFSDFQCPACAATHPVLEKVLAAYGDKIRFVVRDFPLRQIHQNAFRAAQAANAAHAQGKFFEYVELLYRNQNSLDTASLKNFASQIGLDRKRFDADLDGGRFAAEVEKDVQDGVSYGIVGTPTVFVNGVRVRDLSANAFRRAVERALKK